MHLLLERDQFQLSVEAAGASLSYCVHIDPPRRYRGDLTVYLRPPGLSPAHFVRQEAEHLRSFATANLALRTETEQEVSFRNFCSVLPCFRMTRDGLTD